ncbi:MAG: hypothetical protein R6W75_13215 [Smithellaceae bacterium]
MTVSFMQARDFQPYTLPLTRLRFYLLTCLFVAGNLLFPLLVHQIPQGGKILLPIYFFTLIAAYRFGWMMGLTTAVLSVFFNHVLTGMPPAALLPVILVKSLILAFAAAWIANRTQKISLLHLAAVVAAYQAAGGVFEWLYTGSLMAALSDIRMGLPGILVQIIAGYLLLTWQNRRLDRSGAV